MFGAPKNEKPSDATVMSRRSFLKGAAATAGVMAMDGMLNRAEAKKTMTMREWCDARAERMRLHELADLSVEVRERILTREITVVSKFMRSEEGMRILNEGTDEQLEQYLEMASIPMLAEHIAGTRYDVPRDKWPSVGVDFSLDAQGEPKLISVDEIDKTPESQQNCGNGFAISEDVFITNWHVVAYQAEKFYDDNGIPKDSLTKFHDAYEKGMDVAVGRIPEGFRPTYMPEAAFFTLHDEDVHGHYVCVAGIDPDPTSDAHGLKRYPAMAIKMTAHLNKFLNLEDGASRSFVYALPPGEAIEDVKGERPFQGTSGGPVVSNGEIVGLNRALIYHRDQRRGITHELGLFVGPDELKEALNTRKLIYDSPLYHVETE